MEERENKFGVKRPAYPTIAPKIEKEPKNIMTFREFLPAFLALVGISVLVYFTFSYIETQPYQVAALVSLGLSCSYVTQRVDRKSVSSAIWSTLLLGIFVVFMLTVSVLLPKR